MTCSITQSHAESCHPAASVTLCSCSLRSPCFSSAKCGEDAVSALAHASEAVARLFCAFGCAVVMCCVCCDDVLCAVTECCCDVLTPSPAPGFAPRPHTLPSEADRSETSPAADQVP